MSALDNPLAEASLEQFLKQVRPRLKVLFARYRVPPQDTEDILQQALLALVNQWKTVRDPEAWLLGTIRNKCLVYWRDRRRKLYDAVDSTVLEWVAEPHVPAQQSVELRYDLQSMIDRLPDRCRSLLRLRYHLGYEPPELAERLGYRTSSISKVTNRCLAALTRQLVAEGICKKKV